MARHSFSRRRRTSSRRARPSARSRRSGRRPFKSKSRAIRRNPGRSSAAWGPPKRAYRKKRTTMQVTRAIGTQWPPVMRIKESVCASIPLRTITGSTLNAYKFQIKGNSLFAPLAHCCAGVSFTVPSLGVCGQLYEHYRVLSSKIKLKIMWNGNMTTSMGVYWYTEATNVLGDLFVNEAVSTLECNAKSSHIAWFNDAIPGGDSAMKVIRDKRTTSSQFGRKIVRGTTALMDDNTTGQVFGNLSSACPSVASVDPTALWNWNFFLKYISNVNIVAGVTFADMVVDVEYEIEYYNRRVTAGGVE